MKTTVNKSLFWVLIFISIASCNKEETKISKVSVTYIGAGGFLVTNETHKVMIDGVISTGGAAGFITPSWETTEKIRNCEAPFDNIDLYLVGHTHGDHFNARMMDECMTMNAAARLICPPEAVGLLTAVTDNSFSAYQSRVITPDPGTFSCFDTLINDINIRITRFPEFPNHPYGVFTFNILIDDIKLTHLMGDLLNPGDYVTFNFNPDDNDVLLATGGYLDEPEFLKDYLNYRIAIVNHIYRYQYSGATYQEAARELRNEGYKVYVADSSISVYRFRKTGEEIILE